MTILIMYCSKTDPNKAAERKKKKSFYAKMKKVRFCCHNICVPYFHTWEKIIISKMWCLIRIYPEPGFTSDKDPDPDKMARSGSRQMIRILILNVLKNPLFILFLE